MNIVAWNKTTDLAVTPEIAPVDGEWSYNKATKTKRQYNEPKDPVVISIRKISTGAMQRRFTIPEEVFIASDAAATVIKSRLLNASYADLDFQDTIDGVTYICSVLKGGGIIEDEAARVIELLQDGTQTESI